MLLSYQYWRACIASSTSVPRLLQSGIDDAELVPMPFMLFSSAACFLSNIACSSIVDSLLFECCRYWRSGPSCASTCWSCRFLFSLYSCLPYRFLLSIEEFSVQIICCFLVVQPFLPFARIDVDFGTAIETSCTLKAPCCAWDFYHGEITSCSVDRSCPAQYYGFLPCYSCRFWDTLQLTPTVE